MGTDGQPHWDIPKLTNLSLYWWLNFNCLLILHSWNVKIYWPWKGTTTGVPIGPVAEISVGLLTGPPGPLTGLPTTPGSGAWCGWVVVLSGSFVALSGWVIVLRGSFVALSGSLVALSGRMIGVFGGWMVNALTASLRALSRSFNSSLALAAQVGTRAMTPAARLPSPASSKARRVPMGSRRVEASKKIFLSTSALKKSWWVLANCGVRMGLDVIFDMLYYKGKFIGMCDLRRREPRKCLIGLVRGM